MPAASLRAPMPESTRPAIRIAIVGASAQSIDAAQRSRTPP